MTLGSSSFFFRHSEQGGSGRRHSATGRRAHPRARQREGPGGYKPSRSDGAGDVGRDGAREASGTFRRHYAADSDIIHQKKEPNESRPIPNKQQKEADSFLNQPLRRTAATYSPNWWVSTIGADELNFSVRDGKRWDLIALTTAIYYLRDYIRGHVDSLLVKRFSGY